MLKFGSAANWFDLRGIIAEFYCCDSSQILMTNGEIYKNGQKNVHRIPEKRRPVVFL